MIRVTLFDEKTGNPVVDNSARHMNKMLTDACATVVGYELSLISYELYLGGRKIPRHKKAIMKRTLTLACASDVIDRLTQTRFWNGVRNG